VSGRATSTWTVDAALARFLRVAAAIGTRRGWRDEATMTRWAHRRGITATALDAGLWRLHAAGWIEWRLHRRGGRGVPKREWRLHVPSHGRRR